MESAFFIGREKELQEVEKHLLQRSSSRTSFQFALVWGPDGIGKTAILRKFSSQLLEEGVPVIWFAPDSQTHWDTGYAFFRELMASAKTNMGDIEPVITALNAPENALNTDRGETMSVERHWADVLSTILADPENLASGIDLIRDLRLVFIIDDYPNIPSSVRGTFTQFLNRLSDSCLPTQVISLLIASESNVIEIPGTFNQWDSLLKSAVHVRLEPLSLEETLRLLEAHDIDIPSGHRYYQETRGYPALLANIIHNLDHSEEKSNEWYQRGVRLLSTFNELEKRWLSLAAMLRYCTDETVSILAPHREIEECMNWVHSRYPKLFSKGNQGYSLDRDSRIAIATVVERDFPDLFREGSEKIRLFTSVCHTIPDRNHRQMLSLLSEFNHFTPELLRRIFANNADAFLSFLDTKPVYFRHTGETWRLANNVRASINVYNNIVSNEDRSRIRSRIVSAWNEKKADLRIQQMQVEAKLRDVENKNLSLGVSVEKIEKELGKLRHRHHPQTQSVRPSQSRSTRDRSGVFASIMLQTLGVVFLYVSILYFESISFSYLVLSGFCIAAGFILHQGAPNIDIQQPAPVNPGGANYAQIGKLIDQLEFDKVAMLGQKESSRIQIEKNKMELVRIQNLLNQNYSLNNEG